MKKIETYKLKFDKTIKYFTENLRDVNTLSSLLLDTIDFSHGSFSLLLPKNSYNNLHAFTTGGLLPHTHDIVENHVFNKLKINKDLSCFFDSVNERYKPYYEGNLFKICGIHYLDEIYYFNNNTNTNSTLLSQCFQTSYAIWHSLCLLHTSKIQFQIGSNVDSNILKEICQHTSHIIISAYDGEGYIIWGRSLE